MLVQKTAFLPCQNQICFQQAILVHVALNANASDEQYCLL